MDCSTTHQLGIFSHMCSAHFGYERQGKSGAKRDSVLWVTRVLPDRLLLFSSFRQRGFEAQVSPAKAWPARFRVVFRLWQDVARLDYTADPRPLVPGGLGRLPWISLLDLAQIISMLSSDAAVRVEFPSRTLEFPRENGCRITLDFRPPRAVMRCGRCGVLLGGPLVLQRSQRIGPTGALIHFSTKSLLTHRRPIA